MNYTGKMWVSHMGTNSIKREMKTGELIAEIRVELSADIKREKVVVVVEGKSDTAFFKEKVSPNVIIAEVGDGKKKDEVEKTVKDLNKKRVIGICDRDYQQIQETQRIFYYDYCNLEMMLIANDDAMCQITGEFYRGTLTFKELREKILCELKWLSVFRKYRDENLPADKDKQKEWNVNFKEISIPNMIDINGVFQQIIAEQEVDAHSDGFIQSHPVEYQQILQRYNVTSDQLQDLLMVTQGHDFVKCFEYFCSAASSPAPRKGAVEHSLRCAYRMSDFQQTALYAELKAYEGKTSLSILSA